MSVRIAGSDQAQSPTRSPAGSTAGSQKKGDSSFGGVLSSLADDQSASAQPSAKPASEGVAGTKSAPNITPSPLQGPGKPLAASDVAPSGAGSALLIAAPTSDLGARWTIPTVGAGLKDHHSDRSTAKQRDDGVLPTRFDATATTAGALPPTSLLALVQTAAAIPSSGWPTSPVTGASSAGATLPTQALDLGAAAPAGSQSNEGSTSPLIGDIAFQTYLAPAPTTVGQQTVPAPGEGGTTPQIGSLPDARSQADGSLDAVIAPVTQTATRKSQPASPDSYGSTSAEAGSEIDGSATDRAGAAPIGSTFGLVTSSRGASTLPGRDAAPASDVLDNGAAARPGVTGSVDRSTPDSEKPVSLALETTASGTSPTDAIAIDAPGVSSASAAALSGPVQSVADAVVGLAAQPTGSVQAPLDTGSRLSPARTLLLQLSPAGLGTVSVRLHLTGRTLDVSLTASSGQTADLLDHGRDALTRSLGDQNYQINSLVIQRDDAPSVPGSPNAASTDHPREQSASPNGGDPSNGSRQGSDGSAPRQDRSDRQPTPRPSPRARQTGLFV